MFRYQMGCRVLGFWRCRWAEQLGSKCWSAWISFQILLTQSLPSALHFLDLNRACLVPKGRGCSEGRVWFLFFEPADWFTQISGIGFTLPFREGDGALMKWPKSNSRASWLLWFHGSLVQCQPVLLGTDHSGIPPQDPLLRWWHLLLNSVDFQTQGAWGSMVADTCNPTPCACCPVDFFSHTMGSVDRHVFVGAVVT